MRFNHRIVFLGILMGCFSLVILGTASFEYAPENLETIETQNTGVKTDLSGPEHKKSPNTDCKISNLFPEKILHWCDLITRYSKRVNLSPSLIAALIWQESGGDPLAYSHSGAVGLMQVMPRDGLAASFTNSNGKPLFANRPSIEELQDPNFNISYGTGMLAGLVKRYGNIRDALKAYGPRDVSYYYADIVLNLNKQYSNE